MKIRLVDRRSVIDWTPPADLMAALETICRPAGPADWTLDLVLVDDEIMVSLNEGFREKSGVTDVLSFSYLSQVGASEPDVSAGELCARCDLWRNGLEDEADSPVGEVILAPGFISDRCRKEGWAFQSEVALLVAHGSLHVMGWEHRDEATIEAMRGREKELLALADFRHPMLEGES